jgi:hypothetical protein
MRGGLTDLSYPSLAMQGLNWLERHPALVGHAHLPPACRVTCTVRRPIATTAPERAWPCFNSCDVVQNQLLVTQSGESIQRCAVRLRAVQNRGNKPLREETINDSLSMTDSHRSQIGSQRKRAEAAPRRTPGHVVVDPALPTTPESSLADSSFTACCFVCQGSSPQTSWAPLFPHG